jgi:hypothetical protein
MIAIGPWKIQGWQGQDRRRWSLTTDDPGVGTGPSVVEPIVAGPIRATGILVPGDTPRRVNSGNH